MKRYKLGDILTVKHGFPFKGEYFSSNGKYIVLTPGNFYEQGGFKYTQGKEKYYLGESPAEYICSKGDLIVAMTEQTRGLLGSTAIVPEDDLYLHNQRIGLIKFDTSIVDKNYLNYLFRVSWVRSQLESSASGTKIKHTSPERICDVKIHLPPLSEQRKIGSFLAFIDNKISINNRVNATLEAMAKTLYDYWFVQFDFPDEKGRPYKTSGGKMVYNEELGREIPAGWEVKQLKDLCLFSNGINYDKDEAGDKTYHIVNVRNITASSLLLDDNDFDEITLKSSQADRYLVSDNDILVARSGTPGATRLLMNNDGNTIFCGFIIRCIPTDVELRYYLTYALKRLEGTQATKTGGSILQNVSQDTLESVVVVLPDDAILPIFSKKIDVYHSMMQRLIEENHRLAALRDWLLPMLMNGQVGFWKG